MKRERAIGLITHLIFPFYSIICIILVVGICLAKKQADDVNIEVNNPYRLQVELEVKCDWDRDLEDFKYHKFLSIPGKRSIVIKVPSNLRKCQIWPKIRW